MKKILKYLVLGGILIVLGLILNTYRKHTVPKFSIRKIRQASRSFQAHTIHTKRKHANIVAHDFGMKNKKRVGIALGIILCAGIFGETLLKPYGFWLKTSLLDIPTTPFTGTVSPVEMVPNWVRLTDNERKLPFDQIPKNKLMKLPPYDVSAIRKGFTSAWNQNEYERNQYLTYSVLYMGDYKLQANAGNGSHIGVDIKLPYNTPIRSIADGTVYKTQISQSGFGNYVTIAHTNVPDPDKPEKTTTLLSTYAHLNRINVQEGDVVRKGQTIGRSGNSGNSTAPHLHFQIETTDAPFHPYWPFTWKDTQKRGVSHFEAVNTGLGRANGYKYTIDPFPFIVENRDFQFVVEKKEKKENLIASTDPIIETKDSITHDTQDLFSDTDPIPNSNKAFEPELGKNNQKLNYHRAQQSNFAQATTDNESINADKSNQSFNRAMMEEALAFETDHSFIPGEEEIVAVTISDTNLIASNGILIESTLRHLADIVPSRLKEDNFNSKGVAKVRVKTDSDSSFRLIASGDFGQIKSKSLRASVFEDIPKNHEFAESIKYLKDNQIVQGYSDGTFRPQNKINRAEAVKILLEGNAIPPNETLTDFPDVAQNAWFNNYVATAYKKGIVRGYDDGSFQPGKDISRAECTKVALETANIATPQAPNNVYTDVSNDAWYAQYMSVAKRYNFFKTYGNGNVEPARPITRGEAAFIMHKIAEIN